MIDCIFTLDYEVYGNGTGTLGDLVHAPTERLRTIFKKWDARFVTFVEVAELEQIEASNTDPAIDLVKRQIMDLRQEDHEIALHLHPQWYNAEYQHGRWQLDKSEYNLCKLSRPRVVEIVQRALAYMRNVLDQPQFTPLSFRAGNWLFQPTHTAAEVLTEHGVKLDSSVFKGGRQRNHGLDYRQADVNGYFWRFSRDVNRAEASGRMIEVPVHTERTPFWKMPTSKRMSIGNSFGLADQGIRRKVNRTLDFLRWRYPMKLDFCRMTTTELIAMMDSVICEDKRHPEVYRPIVAIGHTKDLCDVGAVDTFLSFLRSRSIGISTFESSYSRLNNALSSS